MRRRALLNTYESSLFEHYIEVKYDVEDNTEFYVLPEDFDLSVIERMERYDFPGRFNEIEIENPTISGTYGNGKSYRFYFKRGDIKLSDEYTGMFGNMDNIVSLDLSQLDTSKMTDMSYMFYDFNYSNCDFDVSTFITKNVTNMCSMFDHCERYVSGLSNFNTSKVTDMSYMFSWCSSIDVEDIKNWDTSNVEDMTNVFGACLTYWGEVDIILKNWDFSSVTTIENMFFDMPLGDYDGQIIDGLYTPKLTNASYFLYGLELYETLTVKNWDTSKIENMNHMFGANDFNTVYLYDFDMTSLTKSKSGNLFPYCYELTELTMTGKPSTVSGVYTTGMFEGIETEGTFYYNSKYDYSNIISVLPSTWTAVPI